MKNKFKITTLLVLAASFLVGVSQVHACDEGDPNCDPLPQGEETSENGTYKVDNAIPGTGNAATEGNLTVGGEVFEDVVAVCGEAEDTINVGQNVPFQVCSVTDLSCWNAMRQEQGQTDFTQEEADSYGKSFDDVFENAVNTGNYDNAINAFRWLTGNNPNPYSFEQGNEVVSTWLGVPKNASSVQSLAWWLGDYCNDCIPEEISCPDTCGYQGGFVSDGCNDIYCEPTLPCPKDKPPKDIPQLLPVTGTEMVADVSLADKLMFFAIVAISATAISFGAISLIEQSKKRKLK